MTTHFKNTESCESARGTNHARLKTIVLIQCTRESAMCFVASSLVLCLYPTTVHAQNPTVAVNVDANLKRHPINPNIYGGSRHHRSIERLEHPAEPERRQQHDATTGS
jgi:hypothetical protein